MQNVLGTLARLAQLQEERELSVEIILLCRVT